MTSKENVLVKRKLTDISAARAIQYIKAREITAVELTEAYLERIERLEPAIHAWAFFDKESALRQAAAIDRKIQNNLPTGKLCGIPIGVKDVFNTADMPTQMGSPIWEGFMPGNDARVVHYLRLADAIIPGKTVTAEFAVHAPGPTANPHHQDYMCGTSSSGSAAAVAAQMIPLSIGTQTAGSTIRPASYCGAYGFKPSFGLIPRTGMLKTTDSLDTVGLFTGAVEDLKILFDVMRVHGPDYPISDALLNDVARQNKAGKSWRIGVIKDPKWDCAETYAKQALLDFAGKLSEIDNISVDIIALPESFNQAHEIHSIIYDCTLAYYFKEEFKRKSLVSDIMYEIIARGRGISLDQYVSAVDGQADLARELDRLFAKDYDILLVLSTGGEALKGRDAQERPDSCLIWTLCGVPAINIPAFKGPNGLPFGLQAVARRYSDYLLLNFVGFLESQMLIPSKVFFDRDACVKSG